MANVCSLEESSVVKLWETEERSVDNRWSAVGPAFIVPCYPPHTDPSFRHPNRRQTDPPRKLETGLLFQCSILELNRQQWTLTKPGAVTLEQRAKRGAEQPGRGGSSESVGIRAEEGGSCLAALWECLFLGGRNSRIVSELSNRTVCPTEVTDQ